MDPFHPTSSSSDQDLNTDKSSAERFSSIRKQKYSGLHRKPSTKPFDEMFVKPAFSNAIWTGPKVKVEEVDEKGKGRQSDIPVVDLPYCSQSDDSSSLAPESDDELYGNETLFFSEVPSTYREMSDPALISPYITQPDDLPPPPSKFADKLNSNYIPSRSEMSEINAYVSTVDDKIFECDKCIADLEAVLQELNDKRSRLQDTRDAHKALTSPVRRLPPEILQTIFVWCLPQNRNAVMHASEAPVLLGRVCSEWRRITFATPEVWSSLHIVPPNVNFSNPTSSAVRFQRKRDLVEAWLSRSGACPLSISLVWFAGDSEEEVRLCGTLLEVLVPLCGRWKSLDLQVPLKMFQPFKGLTVQDVPLLEGLSLMDNRTPLDVDVTDRWPDSLSFAENSTGLRHFALTFFSGGIRLPSIPWSRLTTIYLESNIAFFFGNSRDMLSTLAECSNLDSCTLKFPLSHTASLPPYEKLDMPITLPQLQVLCIDGDQHLQNTFHMSNTLSNICAPKLRKLEILGRSGRPEGCVAPEPLHAIKMLLQRSKCPLEKLNLESMVLLPDEFISCLSLLPHLLELVVHNWAVRMFSTPLPGEETTSENHEIAENKILKALTIPSKEHLSVSASGAEVERNVDEGLSPPEEEQSRDNSEAGSLFTSTIDVALCPKLQRLDFTLCDASQTLLCDFVASRWDDISDGVSRIRSVKCNFTALEEEAVKARMDKFRAEGLDVFITYQVPISDDMNPSPWTGLEGPP